jgi:hypothetical protein
MLVCVLESEKGSGVGQMLGREAWHTGLKNTANGVERSEGNDSISGVCT